MAGKPALALTINLTYTNDATFSAAGLSAADIVNMKAANAYVVSVFTNYFTDNVNVNISVTAVAGTGTLGGSTTFLVGPVTYASLRAAVASDSTTTNDSTALGAGGSLPASDPIATSHAYIVSRAQAKALGLTADSLSTDGTFTFKVVDSATRTTQTIAPCPGNLTTSVWRCTNFRKLWGALD